MQSYDHDQIRFLILRLKDTVNECFDKIIKNYDVYTETRKIGKKYVHKKDFYHYRREIYNLRASIRVNYEFVSKVLKSLATLNTFNMEKVEKMIIKIKEAETVMWSRINNLRREV